MTLLALLCLWSPPAGAAEHVLKVSPRSVVVGYYDATTPPALKINSGDTVQIHTLGVASPERLEAAGLRPEEIQPELRAVAAANPGKRGHFLTGPVFIEGAQPGDVLEVRILKIDMALPYSFNGMGGNGVLADQFKVGTSKIIRLDRERKVGSFGPLVEVPLRPFFGSMGVAPPPDMGRVSSTPPGIYAGNMDNRELIPGTTVFIPVHVPGALFQVGDGHAAQGDGEVDQTGLETSLVGTFEFRVRKDMKLKWPRAETPTHFITMGFDPDINKAMRIAVEEAVDVLAERGGLSRADAYMLASVAVDLRITQLVDVSKGAHVMIPKSLFVGGKK